MPESERALGRPEVNAGVAGIGERRGRCGRESGQREHTQDGTSVDCERMGHGGGWSVVVSSGGATAWRATDSLGRVAMRITVIVNPAAGGGRAGRRVDALLADFPGLNRLDTTGPGHATTLAATADADVVVAAGGDGTLHEVANGLVGRSVALGVLPVGTGNSFCRDFGLHEPQAAVAALLRGAARPVDLLRIAHADGQLHAINLVGLGFSAQAGALVNRRFKALGAVGYVAGVVATLARLQVPVHPMACDGGPFDARPAVLVSLCNSRCTGGTMVMAPSARPDDGLLDVIRVGSMSRTRFLSAFPRIFAGTHVAMPEVEASVAKAVAFDLPGPVDVMVDGEVLRLALRTVDVVPGALRFVA